MSKFHSNISRRNFMKGIGLAGAGLGAAAAAAPVTESKVGEALAIDSRGKLQPFFAILTPLKPMG